MKVNSTDLLKALAVACRVVPNKPIVPLQEYITISASGTHGSIRAFSDTLQIFVKMECSSDDNFTVTIHNTAFVAYIQKLPQNTDITLTKDDNLIIVKWEKGKSSFPICEEDIPEFNNDGEEVMTTSLKNFKVNVAQAKVFCANDELRPAACCVCIDPDNSREDGINFVGLNHIGGIIISDKAKIAQPRQILLHQTSFPVIQNINGIDGEEITISAGDNYIYLQTEDMALRIRAVDASYMPYYRMIPANCNKHLTIDKTGLVSVARRCTACVGDANMLRLSMNSISTISAQNLTNAISAEEVLDIKGYEGEPMEVGLNATQIINAAGVFSDPVIKFSFVENIRPLLVTSENDPIMIILAPMQLV